MVETPEKKLLSLRDAAAVLSTGISFVRAAVKNGELPGFILHNGYRIRVEDLDKFIEHKRQSHGVPA